MSGFFITQYENGVQEGTQFCDLICFFVSNFVSCVCVAEKKKKH
jgi:hypothetical protein